jgi:hypothetical protein
VGDPWSIGSGYLHLVYLQLLLSQKASSASVALGEEELEEHCEGLSWEGVLEVLSSRGLDAEFLREMLQDAVPLPEVRLFFEDAPNAPPPRTSTSLPLRGAGSAPRKCRRSLPSPCGSSSSEQEGWGC